MSTSQEVIYASVALDSAIDRLLDYEVPSHLASSAKLGARLLVPVKGALRKGTLFALKEKPDFSPVRAIAEVLLEKPAVPADLLQLANWMARYYSSPLSLVLRCLLPPHTRGEMKHKTQQLIKSELSLNQLRTLCEELRRKSPKQAEILDALLQAPKGLLLSDLLERTGGSRASVKALIAKKALRSEEVRIDRTHTLDLDYFPTKPKILSDEQEEALVKIKSSLSAGRFETHLLFGVTGSGKTEIYLQAIEYALTLNKGAILLVPEIALTAQTIERLRGRFAQKIAILHCRLSEGEKHDAWHQIYEGKVQIVVGARSALFSPLPNLGLVLVDEEHDSSYKQSELAPSYHARDVAIMRSKLCNATVVLGSATPTLESYQNALSGKYTLSTLKKRSSAASLPSVEIVDMRQERAKAGGFTLFSEKLIGGIKKRLACGEQSLLFLNRRGYHTSQICQRCSATIKCPHCDIALTFHRGANLLACHLCDHRLVPAPRSCPSCGSSEGLKFKGVGTEQVERALHALFPEVRTLRLDADTTKHKGSHEQLFKQFRSGKADVLIGTQMIAKGLHFPSVTLACVLNADAGLNIPDFRASEHVFQLITQVAGRSGRTSLPGEVIIQTSLPDHPLMAHAAAQDFESFFKEEIEVRKLFDYPPFTHLAKLIFTGKESLLVQAEAEKVRALLIQQLPALFEILPLQPAGHPKVKDLFRFQFLIKGQKIGYLTKVLEELPKKLSIAPSVRLLIDIDPLSTFF